MVQRLKRWESPRRQGRNDKGKGGSARQRQLKKQQQMLRKKLKQNSEGKALNQQRGREINLFPFILSVAKINLAESANFLPPPSPSLF
jgi:hypothetical protein